MFKKEKGITLIALIITIIVMLILVGVTVNVALTGGLFTKASEASKQMQIEAEKEELLSSVVAAIGYDGKVVLTDIELPTGWTGADGTYTSPKGNTYTVDENGKITGGDKDTKPTLKQIKEGDVWKNVTFSSMKLSNAGITLPAIDYIEYDENGEALEEPIAIEMSEYDFGIENYAEFVYMKKDDGSLIFTIVTTDGLIIYYLFYLGEDTRASLENEFGFEAELGKFYIMENDQLREMAEEEVNNIKFSGTIVTNFYAHNSNNYGYQDIPSQMAAWFSGEVEYAE